MKNMQKKKKYLREREREEKKKKWNECKILEIILGLFFTPYHPMKYKAHFFEGQLWLSYHDRT